MKKKQSLTQEQELCLEVHYIVRIFEKCIGLHYNLNSLTVCVKEVKYSQ